MPIEGDDKDWTWVLHRACPECGMDTSTFAREEVGAMIRANAGTWPGLLADPRANRRPSDDVWSALEYGCHVRDVFRIYDGRLERMMTEVDPLYPNWDQDATAVEDRYGEQDPAQLAADLLAAGLQLAARFDQVGPDQWDRTGRRGDGAVFTIETFARYLIHDPVHHLDDVSRGYAAIG